MKAKELTKDEAYKAMYYFLDNCYSMGWKEIGALLGSMSLLNDGDTVDPAITEDWEEAVKKALNPNNMDDIILKIQK